jgi:hypothetical protein
MAKSWLKSEFGRFFVRINEYTDLLVKLFEAREVTLPPEKRKEILTEILLSEKKQIHEAFVLKIYVSWEVLVESLFVECLSCDPSGYAEQKSITLPKKLTRNICRGLISGLGYFDFKDTADLKGKAKKVLAPRYNPFKMIPSDEGKKIDEFCIIRNYLAHYSDSSKQSLMRMYRNSYNLTFREPGDFLFEIVEFVELGKRDKQTRFASYINAFLKAADEMALFLGVY